MAGNITSIAGGKMEFTAKKIRMESTRDSIQLHSAKDTVFNAKGKVNYDEYVPGNNANPNIVRGYWTDAEDQPVTEALVGDTVRLHIETRGIPNGAFIWFGLYDDDRILNREEDGEDDHYRLVNPGTGSGYFREAVHAGKAIITAKLSHLESAVAADPDRMLELYYRVSYRNQNIDLPRNTDDYLKLFSLPIYIDRYRVPGLNSSMNDIADDMAFGFGIKNTGGVYTHTSDLASYLEAYNQNGFDAESHALFSNKEDFEPLLAIPTNLPLNPPAGTVIISPDKTRVVQPDPVAVQNGIIASRNRNRKAVYDATQIFDTHYRFEIKGHTLFSIPTSFDTYTMSKLSNEHLFVLFTDLTTLLFAQDAMQENLVRMINRFKSNTGGIYEDEVLNKTAFNNSNTQEFFNYIEQKLKLKIQKNRGHLWNVQDKVIKTTASAKKHERVVYNNDTLGGLTIATNDIWAHEVQLTACRTVNNICTATYEVTLWDHFGLDLPDLEKKFNLLPVASYAFASWFVLQHLKGYKPFLTKIKFSKEFSFNM